MAHLVECPPPTPEAWVQSPLPVAGEAVFFYIHICSDILVLCVSSAESTCSSKTGFIREKQGLSEKKRFIMKNRVYQRKTGFIREKQGFLSVVDD